MQITTLPYTTAPQCPCFVPLYESCNADCSADEEIDLALVLSYTEQDSREILTHEEVMCRFEMLRKPFQATLERFFRYHERRAFERGEDEGFDYQTARGEPYMGTSTLDAPAPPESEPVLRSQHSEPSMTQLRLQTLRARNEMLWSELTSASSQPTFSLHTPNKNYENWRERGASRSIATLLPPTPAPSALSTMIRSPAVEDPRNVERQEWESDDYVNTPDFVTIAQSSATTTPCVENLLAATMSAPHTRTNRTDSRNPPGSSEVLEDLRNVRVTNSRFNNTQSQAPHVEGSWPMITLSPRGCRSITDPVIVKLTFDSIRCTGVVLTNANRTSVAQRANAKACGQRLPYLEADSTKFEVYLSTSRANSNAVMVGLWLEGTDHAYVYRGDGTRATSFDGPGQPYGTPFGTNSVVWVHMDYQHWELSFHVDGTPQGIAFRFRPSTRPPMMIPVVVLGRTGDRATIRNRLACTSKIKGGIGAR